jgi:O-antigen/teichoic acid export membrane protein
VVIMVVQSAFTAALTTLLVVVYHGGVTGWLVGTVLANLAGLIVAMVAIPWRRPKPFRADLTRESLRLGVPLVPHFLSQWALQLADRLVLNSIVSTTLLGVYSLASNFGLPILLLVQSLNQAMLPGYAKVGTSGSDSEELRHTVVLQIRAVLALTLAGLLFGPIAFHLVAPPAYEASGALIVWTALGYGLLGLAQIPMNGIGMVKGETRKIWLFTASSAAINIGWIVVFAPSQGPLAAAVANTVAYGFMAATLTLYAWRRQVRLGLKLVDVALPIAAGAALYVAAVSISGDHSLTDFLVRVGFVVLGLLAVGVPQWHRRRRA